VSAVGNPRVSELEGHAQRAMRSGQLEQAARIWRDVLALVPEHPQALFHLGQHALYGKDYERSKTLLTRAAIAAPNEAAIPLNLAFVFRGLGDVQSELDSLTRALTIDPYFYPALLAKGMLLERTGDTRQAARIYKDVVGISPPDGQLPADLRAPMRHAREMVESNALELDAFLEARLKDIRSRHANEAVDRFEQCREVALGRKKIFTQQPSLLHFPALPPIQFYDDAMFPWLSRLEAASDTIRDELLVVLREDADETQPYVSHPDGAPINQWAELNHSPRWSVFFLWKDGKRDDAHCARCPKTAALMGEIPMMDLDGFAPTVMFSILAPHTHIPPHSSVTNARLVVHLPLIVPQGCRFRVGNETRDWRYAKAWVFDDTIDHEAWNDSDEVRVILMIDVWNPFLSPAERDLVTGLLNGIREYYRLPIPRP
jgi:tetratricopeptide (TPR) repeat protein